MSDYDTDLLKPTKTTIRKIATEEQLAITWVYQDRPTVRRYRDVLSQPDTKTDEVSSYNPESGYKLICRNGDTRYVLSLPNTAWKDSPIKRRISMSSWALKKKGGQH